PPMRNADDNDALSEQGHTRRQRGDLSATTLAMARTTWGAEALVDDSEFKHPEVLNPNPMLHTGNVGGLTFNTGASASPFGARMDDDLPLSAAARDHIETRAIPARKALRVPIDDSGWYEDMPPAKKRREKEKFDQAFDRVMALAKFQAHEKLHLVEMIRSMVARPADVNRTEGGFLPRREAMAALKVLERNFRRQQWPLLDGAINVVSRPALEALRRNGYQLRDGTGKNRPVGPKWSDWVDVMLAEAFTDDPRMRGYPAVSNVIDGLLYEYRKDVKGLLSTGSISPRAAQSLAVASTDSGLLIASPQVRRELNAPSVQAGQQMFS